MAAVSSLRDQLKAGSVSGQALAAPLVMLGSFDAPALHQEAPQPVRLGEFYRAVLPEGGRYVLYQDKKQSFFPTIEDLVRATELRIETQGLYYATAAYGDADNRMGEVR